MNVAYLPKRFAPTLYDLIPCQGGWDLETPTLSLPNGFVRDAQNFEVSHVKGGGYRRCDGYERYDGQAAPSSATFTIVQVSALEDSWAPGDFIGYTESPTGSLNPQSATVVATASNYVVIMNPTGSFSPGGYLFDIAGNISSPIVAQTVVPTSEQVAQYTAAAAALLRAEIDPVPGSGPVRGVAVLTIAGTDQVFAWRDNAGATAGAIYKATASGWTAVTLYKEVSFTAMTGAPTEGDTLTQGGVTATIKRVVHETGSLTGGTAAGRLIITSVAGGNFAAGAATAPGSTMTLSGAQTDITIAAGGRYVFMTHNFFGQAGTRRLYGASGVQRAFEFDGDVYLTINHNDSNHHPSFIAEHKDHLMLGVDSSLIHSGPGEPYKINAAAGGGEIALGDTITNFLPQAGDAQGGAFGITTETDVHMLYGSSALTWNRIRLNLGLMGIAYTGTRLNQSFWLDDNGVTNLRAGQDFGNFNSAMITNTISPYIVEKRGLTVGSALNREKSQYRLFFSDGTALYATIVNGRLYGLMPQRLADTFFCLWDGVSANTRMFAGAASGGHVYQLDIGTSFDGDAIDAYLIFNWNPTRSPRTIKRYRKASIEMQGGAFAQIQFGYNLSYGRAGVPPETSRSYTAVSTGAPFWDVFTWDEFYWDGSAVTPTEVEMRGSGENVKLIISSGTDYIESYTINSILMHYTPRRGLR
jgi:hypothetical protein